MMVQLWRITGGEKRIRKEPAEIFQPAEGPAENASDAGEESEGNKTKKRGGNRQKRKTPGPAAIPRLGPREENGNRFFNRLCLTYLIKYMIA
jgi:hypothetical protein